MVTPVRNICNVSASYSSFVFVMPIVALRRLSLSPVWHTFSVYLWFSLYATTGWNIHYIYIYVICTYIIHIHIHIHIVYTYMYVYRMLNVKHTKYDIWIRIFLKFFHKKRLLGFSGCNIWREIQVKEKYEWDLVEKKNIIKFSF